jgi:hypothetical protein
MHLLRVGGKRKSWIAEGSFVMFGYERKKDEKERATRGHVTTSVSLCGARRRQRQACEHGAEALSCEAR